MNLFNVITDEQLLHFALSYINSVDTGKEVHPIAEQIVLLYIIKEWAKIGKTEFTENEINEKYQDLLLQHILGELTDKGLVDVTFDKSGEIMYSLTESGKQKVKGIVNNDKML